MTLINIYLSNQYVLIPKTGKRGFNNFIATLGDRSNAVALATK